MKHLMMLTFCLPALAAAGITSSDAPRMLMHLLGYVASDYSGAVQNGKIVSREEFAEMTEFSRTARETAGTIAVVRANPRILAELDRLRDLVATKADSHKVAAVAQSAQKMVVRETGLRITPAFWPDRAKGKTLFAENCAQCHGANGHGDGPAAGNQSPPPFNFHGDKADSLSPFQAFNSIRLGVPGTTMAPFPQFSDEQVWDLAFYVMSLRHEGEAPSTELVRAEHRWPIALALAASDSDAQLRESISGTSADKELAVAAIRMKMPSHGSGSSLTVAVAQLNQSVSFARQGKWEQAQSASVKAYLDGVEPAEAELRSRDAAFTSNLEQKMAELRSAIQRQQPLSTIDATAAEALAALRRGEGILAEQIASPAFTFSVAAGIFLREAFEAVLIIITLLGIIRSVGSRPALLAVHAGWLFAIGLGLLAWVFSGWLIGISGAQREMLEAVTSLIAVAVLLYFGFWLHQKSEIGKWRAFINDKVKTALAGKKLWALGMISFMAVFREALETVIFLRALLIEAGPHQQLALGAGVLVSFLIVLVLASALVRFSVRLPLRQLFALSSFVMVLLALILVGKAAHSFQETGLLTITMLPLPFHFDLIGLYPTYETLIPQLGVVALSVGYWLYTRRYALK